VDFSEAMIARGKDLFPHLDLRVMQEKKIPLPDESCDAVILFAVLTCIAENEAQEFLLKEVRRF
jgi:ubiquinone/menaquinone biosynthesis C-methylase UbiE